MKVKKILLMAFCFIAVMSCEENEGTLTSTSDNGILKFKDVEEMMAFAKEPTTGNPTFQSFETIYQKAIEKIGAVQTEGEHANLLKSNQDIVKLENETYMPLLSNSVYRKVINRERLYISGEYVHKVFDDQFIVYTKTKNIEGLRAIQSLDNLDPSVFTVVQYQDINSNTDGVEGRTAANCGANLSANYFDNHSNCRNDRRIYVRGYTWYAISGNTYYPSVISEAWGELRTGTFCNWKKYSTRLSTRNCSFTVTVVINGITHSFVYTNADLPDHNGTGDEGSYTIYEGALNNITWNGGAIPTIQFTQIHLEANSRGTGDNWVVLDCQ